MGNKNAKHAVNNEDNKKKEAVKRESTKKAPRRTSKKIEEKNKELNEENTVLLNLRVKNGEQIPEMEDDIDPKTGKKKKKHRVLKVMLTILLIIIIVAGAIFGKYVYDAGGSISGAVMNIVKDVLGDQDPVFVLVMGVSEDISVELTDTIILIGYNPDNNQAFMLSIPRDTFVGRSEASAGGYDKINALYQTSPEKTVEAVENLTGVKIDYYVTVKTGALVKIVDIIGGVEFDVPMDMNYDDDSQDLHIHLQKGNQVLNGDQAEQLVRFRHNNNGSSYTSDYGDNDIGRMRTQREFIKVVGNKMVKTNSVDKLKEIAQTIFDNLSTNMPLSTVLTYIPYAVNVDMENNLSMDQLPGSPALINELWFYRANTSETQELMNSYAEKLGLSQEEKDKYFRPIPQRSSGGGSSSKKTTTENTTTNNTTVTNTTTNSNNNATSNTTTNKNETKNNNSAGNTSTGNGSSSTGDSGSSSSSGNSGSSSGTGDSGSSSGSGNSGSSSSSGDSGSSSSSGDSGSSSGTGDSGSGSSSSGGSESGASGSGGSGSSSGTGDSGSSSSTGDSGSGSGSGDSGSGSGE